ncbi:ABC transporter permease [Halalkalibacter sp. APA_J-10(15)]|uniref:ABC transporter permease n=1 Tax=Halalkalibacter sp. APA_J-10(15) TaxID=2933805 RepID=UPI001FF17A04|nr:hypothetical protein [Halalkalibacter sp. APA_J-10(15)]MCK0472787.1 hypothetical protein [Halalkalibacter sp. APA_J-10(15)]
MNKKWIDMIKRMSIIIALPLGMFLILSFLTSLQGVQLFNNAGHVQTFVRSTAIIAFTAWALALNLNSGRFDFSLGSMALLSSIVGTQLTIMFDLPAVFLIILTVLIGGLLGFISGMIYIILKLPPIITSVGVMLLYEALSFIVTRGEGLLISTQFQLLTLPTTRNLLIILIVGFLFMYILMNYTRFDYNHKALQHGQEIAVKTGIQEKRNAVATYAITGMLMGVVGFINISAQGFASVALNFSSISAMFIAFLPLFIGGYIGRYSEERFGILIGAVTMGIVTLGFVRLDVAYYNQEFINAILLVLFLAYLNNEGKLSSLFKYNRKTTLNTR